MTQNVIPDSFVVVSAPFLTKHIRLLPGATNWESIAELLEVPPSHFGDLLKLGAIYVNQVRANVQTQFLEGDYVRAHLRPRRFQIESVNWNDRIVFENEHFACVNKPANVPVHPTVDNCVENVLSQIEALRKTPYLITQRLDQATRGLFILAKTKIFQRFFNDLLRTGQVHKFYIAETKELVPTGLHVHHMQRSPRAPKSVGDSPGEDTLECRLEVVACVQRDERYQNLIRLETGRTHQIRAQLSHLGTPILGDTMYGEHPRDDFGLSSSLLAFRCSVTDSTFVFDQSPPYLKTAIHLHLSKFGFPNEPN